MPSVRSSFKVILLDFDGVLVDSNAVKDKAFEHVFAGEKKHLPEILAYHHRTNIIRFEKFRYIYEHILCRPYTLQDEQRLAEEFSAYCITQVIQCPWVEGAEEFLKAFKDKRPMHLISINPPDDLQAILKARHMEHYFKGVYAVNGLKTEAIISILKQEQITPKEAVFIGDSRGDLESAHQAGVFFIGRRSNYDFSKQACPSFTNMTEVLHFIQHL